MTPLTPTQELETQWQEACDEITKDALEVWAALQDERGEQ